VVCKRSHGCAVLFSALHIFLVNDFIPIEIYYEHTPNGNESGGSLHSLLGISNLPYNKHLL